jgi:hypothetical protein
MMPVRIEDKEVTHVLLADGYWHKVADQSFAVTAYQLCHNQQTAHSVTPGAAWKEADGPWFFCPIASVLAVRASAAGKEKSKRRSR